MQVYWKKDWTRILVLFLILRSVYSVLGVIISSNPNLQVNKTVVDSLLYHDYFSNHFVNVWARWDTDWYLRIAKFGYNATDGTIAFSPLFPYLTHLLASITVNYLASALIISNIFALVVLILFYELASTMGMDNKQAFFSVLSMAFFPSAFFLFSAYTESIFIALVLGTFLATHRRHWLLAGFLGGLATLARYQGVLLTPVLLWIFLVAHTETSVLEPFSQIRQVFCVFTTRQGRGRLFRAFKNSSWFGLLIPVLVYIFYSYYISHNFGSVAEALMEHWGISVVSPWVGFVQFLQRLFFTPRIAMDYIDLFLLFVAIGLLVANLYRLNPAFIIYSLFILVSLFMRGTVPHLLESFNRYLLAVFPIFLAVGYIKDFKTRLIIWSASFEIQFYLLYIFLIGGWVA
jgi:hypothetical protein